MSVTKMAFISYARQNLATVERLKTDLRAKQIPFWVDHEALTPGTPDYDDAIQKAIQRSYAVIYIASPESKRSRYAQGELAVADRYKVPIIPFWIQGNHILDCVPVGLARAQYIDARVYTAQAVLDLLNALKNYGIDGTGKDDPPVLPIAPVPQQPQRNPMRGVAAVLVALMAIASLTVLGFIGGQNIKGTFNTQIGSSLGLVLGLALGFFVWTTISKPRPSVQAGTVTIDAAPPKQQKQAVMDESLMTPDFFHALSLELSGIAEIQPPPQLPLYPQTEPSPSPPTRADMHEDTDLLTDLQRIMDNPLI